ncbi:p-glycoprotein e [Leptomonas seymouri]|uniref:p-glycoprotein e n=1 Tax=Leptomonas seymouri TaxID=5684 RepID=A0A0N0P2L1_LEPSE|nr:p-glycoprotein e [Leptomonas seymouri]|eukprot:KPI82647.1 p-glycoprotein e [Leptomonas seymouri]
MSCPSTDQGSTPPPPDTEAERVVFPESLAEEPLSGFEEREREQQVVRASWAAEVQALWGPEPHYEEQPEDRGGLVCGSLFYTWMGQYISQASREELTQEGLPRPMRAYRAYNVGTRLSSQMQLQQERRHAWDGHIGARVGVRWDAASDGVLRWVGAVQQYGTPDQLYAGVEWLVAPARRDVGGCACGAAMTLAGLLPTAPAPSTAARWTASFSSTFRMTTRWPLVSGWRTSSFAESCRLLGRGRPRPFRCGGLSGRSAVHASFLLCCVALSAM